MRDAPPEDVLRFDELLPLELLRDDELRFDDDRLLLELEPDLELELERFDFDFDSAIFSPLVDLGILVGQVDLLCSLLSGAQTSDRQAVE